VPRVFRPVAFLFLEMRGPDICPGLITRQSHRVTKPGPRSGPHSTRHLLQYAGATDNGDQTRFLFDLPCPCDATRSLACGRTDKSIPQRAGEWTCQWHPKADLALLHSERSGPSVASAVRNSNPSLRNVGAYCIRPYGGRERHCGVSHAAAPAAAVSSVSRSARDRISQSGCSRRRLRSKRIACGGRVRR